MATPATHHRCPVRPAVSLAVWPVTRTSARTRGRYLLACTAQLLRPNGVVAMTVRPWWRDGQLIDLPGALVRVGEEARLVLYECNVALLAALRDDHLVPRSSF